MRPGMSTVDGSADIGPILSTGEHPPWQRLIGEVSGCRSGVSFRSNSEDPSTIRAEIPLTIPGRSGMKCDDPCGFLGLLDKDSLL